jgi:hypothetical protein
VIVEGGQVIELAKPDLATGAKWCAYHGIEPDADGVVVLFKAVDADFVSPRGMAYMPGSAPVAPDWDGGERECGGGLHFSPSPGHALAFVSDASRFVGCPVRVAEIVTHPDGQYPNKVKAPGCCGPVFEVDRDGEPVAPRVAS